MRRIRGVRDTITWADSSQRSTASLVDIKTAEDDDIWALAATEDSSQVEFPRGAGGLTSVFDPFSLARLAWDASMLGAIIFVVVVTPFEMAFIACPGTLLQPPRTRASIGLWTLNRFVDAGFVGDLFLAFNTAYFDDAAGSWVVERDAIAWAYVSGPWFWVDIISLLPYSALPVPQRAGLLRFVKLLRLLRLIRAFKSPRILANLYKHITLHNRTQTLGKYILLLLVTVHWAACALRMTTGAHLDACVNAAACPPTVLTASSFWGEGIWAQYGAAVLWAFQCLQGEAVAETHPELTLSVMVMLFGLLELSFMLGELTNALTNLDPVGNEFKLTFDSLNDYMAKKNFPHALRLRLREYIMLAEPVYRDNYYHALLQKLSPRLEAIVAHQNLGNVVNRIPFFAYTLQRAYGIRPGVIVVIKPRIDEADEVALQRGACRHGRIKAVSAYLKYDIKYLDNEVFEIDVSHARVVVDRGDFQARRRIQQTLYQRDHFVIAVARLLEPMLVMHSDIIVYRDLSLNDTMYVVDSGYVVLFGSDPVRPERVLVRRANDSFGDDIAMNVGGALPLLRQFTAKAKRKTRLFTLASVQFNALLAGPAFSIFRNSIKLYGRWMRVRQALFAKLRSGDVSRRLFSLRSQRQPSVGIPTLGRTTAAACAARIATLPDAAVIEVERLLTELDTCLQAGPIPTNARANLNPEDFATTVWRGVRPT